MRRRFLPLAAAFSMMAAAGDEQQSVASRESVPAPNGETFSHDGDQAAELLRQAEHAQDAAEAA